MKWLRFEELPDIDASYVAMGSNGRAYSASYSRQCKCLFMAIPKGVELSLFIKEESLPVLEDTDPQEVHVGMVFFVSKYNAWGQCILKRELESCYFVALRRGGKIFYEYVNKRNKKEQQERNCHVKIKNLC